MKTTIWTILACLSAACVARADGTNELSDEKARASYALGMNLGSGLKRQEADVDFDLILRGLKDAKAGGPTLMTEEQVRATLIAFQQESQRRIAASNKKKAEEFLAKNRTQPGIITTTSGLQYKVLTEGSGVSPGSNDLVTVNYRGTFLDGTEFDTTYKRGQPTKVNLGSLGGFMRGWAEALTKMKEGAKWQLFIPPDLAYGERGRPGVPPNSLLIYELELLDFSPPAATPVAAPLTSDIIKVPSLEEMKKGAQIETIKAEDVDKLIKQAATNQPPSSEKK